MVRLKNISLKLSTRLPTEDMNPRTVSLGSFPDDEFNIDVFRILT